MSRQSRLVTVLLVFVGAFLVLITILLFASGIFSAFERSVQEEGPAGFHGALIAPVDTSATA